MAGFIGFSLVVVIGVATLVSVPGPWRLRIPEIVGLASIVLVIAALVDRRHRLSKPLKVGLSVVAVLCGIALVFEAALITNKKTHKPPQPGLQQPNVAKLAGVPMQVPYGQQYGGLLMNQPLSILATPVRRKPPRTVRIIVSLETLRGPIVSCPSTKPLTMGHTIPLDYLGYQYHVAIQNVGPDGVVLWAGRFIRTENGIGKNCQPYPGYNIYKSPPRR